MPLKAIGRELGAMAALLSLVCGAQIARSVPIVNAAVLPAPDEAATPLPGFLTLPAADALRVVRAVATDIDNDGDLDVVANEGTLDLAVWVNDGAGHLTRKRPEHSSDWQAEPPLPSFSDRGDTSQPPDRNDAPPVHACHVATHAGPSRDRLISRVPAHPPSSPIAFTRTPRAPPASPILS